MAPPRRHLVCPRKIEGIVSGERRRQAVRLRGTADRGVGFSFTCTHVGDQPEFGLSSRALSSAWYMCCLFYVGLGQEAVSVRRHSFFAEFRVLVPRGVGRALVWFFKRCWHRAI